MRRIASATLMQFLESPEFLEEGIPTMGFTVLLLLLFRFIVVGEVCIGAERLSLVCCCRKVPNIGRLQKNNGPWEKELEKGKVYNKFQPATNLLITNYPNCGGSEMRSWCHETVAKDWQKFRSTENYNKLAYHTEFPGWQTERTEKFP